MTETTHLLTPDLIEAALPQTPKNFDPAITVIATARPRQLATALRHDSRVFIAEEYREASDRMQRLHEEEMAALKARQAAALQGIKEEFRVPPIVDVAAVNAETEVIALNTSALQRQERKSDLRRITNARVRLAKGAMALAFAPGALLGFGGAEAFLCGLQQDGVVKVKDDASILPGSEPAVIPGFSDIADGSYTTSVQEGKVVITTKSQAKGQEFSVKYPYAANFELTGKEAALGLRKVLPILQYAKDHSATIEKVLIKGEASDEPLLGIPEPQNKVLALDRAHDAKHGFKKIATTVGIPIGDTQIKVQGQERVLRKNARDDIAKFARSAGLQPTELLRQYNTKSGIFAGKNAAAADDLDNYIGNARGVTYSVKMAVPTQVATPTTVSVAKEHVIDGLNGEWLAGGAAFLLGIVSMATLSEMFGGHLARIRARRLLKKG